jgi:HIRAN domain
VGLFGRKPSLNPEQLEIAIPNDHSLAQGFSVEIEIVGESFYQDHIRALAKIVGNGRFPIRLIAEPANKYDKNAVAVSTNFATVGHLSRQTAKLWQPIVLAASSRKEIIVGAALARSQSGTNYGVFGTVTRPFNMAVLSDVQPSSQTSSKIEKALAILEDALDADPETIAQRRSQVAKALKAGKTLYAHVLSFDEQDDRHNPALIGICRQYLLDVEATSETSAESHQTEDVIDTFLEDWHFQTGTTR